MGHEAKTSFVKASGKDRRVKEVKIRGVVKGEEGSARRVSRGKANRERRW